MAKRTPRPWDSKIYNDEWFQELERQRRNRLQNAALQLQMHQRKAAQQSAYAQGTLSSKPLLSTNSLQQYMNQLQKQSQSQLQSLQQQPRRPKPMNPTLPPPPFLEGYKVTVRTGKTVWTVHHFEEHTDYMSGRPERYYFLQDDNGRETRELETELRIFEGSQPKKAVVDFDSVVISDEKRQQILEAMEQVNQNDLIFNKWGFGETIEKGRGVSMLFWGPPGTGKTLMAQAIANKLNCTLKVISTADIESSAPGEAERNIRKHFSEAKGGKSVLLFDECDSLVFDRAGTGPILSAQINELLSQIERFDGITLFTTNRLGTLDEAVNRRLALKLEFSMPNRKERAEIWKRMFPEQAPIDKDVNWMRLAVVAVTGGYIKNSVLRAARMAAIEDLPDDKKKIKMKHLVKALKLETESMIDFEDARKQHRGGIGHVTRGANGQNVVQAGAGTGRTVEEEIERTEQETADESA